ncbi:MAG: peptidyl-prolyl cis-trans isomerase [Bacillota bacterium]
MTEAFSKYGRSRLVVGIAVLVVAALLAGSALGGYALGTRGAGGGETVAVVNGEPVSRDELYAEMYTQTGDQTLQELIKRKLILQEGRAQGVEIADADIQARLNEVIESGFASREEFEEALAAYGLEQKDLEQQMRIQLTVEALLGKQVELDEAEVKAHFEANQERFGEPERLEARHIVLKTREEAENVRSELAAGADFAALAREKSVDTLTAGGGGNLDPIRNGEFIPAWQKALFGKEAGLVDEVMETESGFHVVEILEKHPATAAVFADVEAKVRRELTEQEITRLYPAWLDSLLAKAKVEYK